MVLAKDDTILFEMSHDWIFQKKQEILRNAIDIAEYEKSIITDKILRRKYYQCGDQYVTPESIPPWLSQREAKEEVTSSKYPQHLANLVLRHNLL